MANEMPFQPQGITTFWSVKILYCLVPRHFCAQLAKSHHVKQNIRELRQAARETVHILHMSLSISQRLEWQTSTVSTSTTYTVYVGCVGLAARQLHFI